MLSDSFSKYFIKKIIKEVQPQAQKPGRNQEEGQSGVRTYFYPIHVRNLSHPGFFRSKRRSAGILKFVPRRSRRAVAGQIQVSNLINFFSLDT